MISRRLVFKIHQLHNSGLSNCSIASELRLDRGTISRYIKNPEPDKKKRKKKPSKLDPFRDKIDEMLNECSSVRATVVLQRLQKQGFTGGITIVRDLLKQKRANQKQLQPFTRFESPPGQQMQVDWGHFGSLPYENGTRKLYCLAVIEAHSRMLYVHFTHSQKQEALHQGLLAAFNYFGGCPKELVVDNMLTAVTERSGTLIRFNEQFLDFLRVLKIVPRACNVRAPYEKGKVENAIKYIRNNFWPLRKFTSLEDVQSQAMAWLNQVANVRIHQTTNQKPVERLQKNKLAVLADTPDCRETLTLKVYKDFGARFDCNVYTVPPWAVGKNIILKANHHIVSIYYKEKLIVTHLRSWAKKKRIELPAHAEQVRKLRKKIYQDQQIRVFLSLGQLAADYLEKLADARQPIKKTVDRLLKLLDEYGQSSFLYVLQIALSKKLYGAEYVENLLYQEMTPASTHPPVKLRKQDLNKIRLTAPSLAEYDALVMKRRKNNHA